MFVLRSSMGRSPNWRLSPWSGFLRLPSDRFAVFLRGAFPTPGWSRFGRFAFLISGILLLHLSCFAGGQTVHRFDFTQAETAREWGQPHHISALTPASEGLGITISGGDPYFHGPARNYPADTPLWLVVRLKSEQGGMGEVFYYRDHAEAGKSVQFRVPAGEWTEARAPLPPLGPGYRLRLDPPGTAGKAVLAEIRIEKRIQLAESWPEWRPPQAASDLRVAAGDLELFSGNATPFGYELRVQGSSMGFGHPRPRIGYLEGEELRWVELSEGAVKSGQGKESGWSVTAECRDPNGARWIYEQNFRVDTPGAILVETRVSVDQDRPVVYLPMHMLVAGEKSFGARKTQGLFAGLEYLEDEPSSSEADIIGPESNRRVPAPHKITFPLMAVQAGGRYLGLIWEEPLEFSALFDSPDRTFGSGGHVMGVLFPGWTGGNREEGSLLPYTGGLLKANEPVVSTAQIIGGMGTSVVSAVRQYVGLRGLPELPESGLNFSDYIRLAAQGWLNSKAREGNLYRHAVWPGFNPQPAADAAVFQLWLAGHAADPDLAAALRDSAAGALSMVDKRNYYHSMISHIRAPAAPLVFGGLPEAVEAARQLARAQLGRFAEDGSIPYQRGRGGVDYGKTHFAPDANGLTAQVVLTLLEAAVFCGEGELISAALEKLRALDKFRGTAPRGAQTWEVPLHTPDILASAHLVRAYALGYELTGEREFLEEAIYWAWTGVPFVYLVNPVGKPIGPYSTIAVLGATNWKAPVWFGRPVQWCGMVYADALYRLARHDSEGPWKKLADGITIAGLQHTWKENDRDRVGLLADFVELEAQSLEGPAINPGTVGAGAVRLYRKIPFYDFRAFRGNGLIVHAPGEIAMEFEKEKSVAFTVRGWPRESYPVVVHGFSGAPDLKVNGARVMPEFDGANGRLVLKLAGEARVELELR